MATETAQRPNKVYYFSCVVLKDDAIWADEVDRKNADTISHDNDDDDLDNDAIYICTK